MPDSVRPHRWQPISLPRPWDSPGKNTGVGCHFLLQGMKVKSQSEVAQSCSTLSDLMDCSLPGSSVHGIFQARVLEWGAIVFSTKLRWGSFYPSRDLSGQRKVPGRDLAPEVSEEEPLPSWQAWIFVQEPLWQTGGTYRPRLRAVFLNALSEICQIARKANYIKRNLLKCV